VSEGFRIVELLYCTSLLVMVASGDNPGSSPRKLKLWNSQNKDIIAEIPFDSTIITCKLNKARLVVYIETQQVHIFELATMNCIQILSTNNNPSGLLALSSEQKSYLAFPGYPGRVVLYDATNCRLLTQINAHKGNIAQIQFDKHGGLLTFPGALLITGVKY
jgi:autophagy-related protein 18